MSDNSKPNQTVQPPCSEQQVKIHNGMGDGIMIPRAKLEHLKDLAENENSEEESSERLFFDLALGIFCTCLGLIFCLKDLNEIVKIIVIAGLIESGLLGFRSLVALKDEKKKITKTKNHNATNLKIGNYSLSTSNCKLLFKGLQDKIIGYKKLIKNLICLRKFGIAVIELLRYYLHLLEPLCVGLLLEVLCVF